MLGLVGRPSQSVLCGQQSLPQCRVWSRALLQCQEWSSGPPTVSGVVGRPCQSVGGDLEALPECWDWSEGPPGVS